MKNNFLNMKKTILYLFCLLFLPSIILAQKSFEITLANQKVSANLPKSHRITNVIDARKGTKNIGLAILTATHETLPINFSNNLSSEFSNLFESKFDKHIKTITLRINELRLQELTKQQIFTAYIDVTFIEKKGDTISELFTASNFAIRGKSGLFREKIHADNILEVMNKCVNDFTSRTNNNLITSKNIKIEHLFQRDSLPLPDLEAYKKGVFQTFYDFRDHTPDTFSTLKFKKFYTERSGEYYMKLEQPNDAPWGFSDGKTCFVKAFGEDIYLPIYKKNNNLIYFDKFISDEKNNITVYIAYIPSGVGLAGGIIGGIISLAISAVIHEVREVKHTKFGSIQLNINSGMINTYKGEIEAPKKPILYLMNEKYGNNETLFFTVNDTSMCKLPKGSFAKLPLNDIEITQKICVEKANGSEKTCQEFQFDDKKKNIFVVKIKKDKSIELKQLTKKSDIDAAMYDLK